MRPHSRNIPRQNLDEKNLIAEQPGRLVLMSGLILSFIFGLSIRGVTAPNKIKSMIESAASKIHNDVKVDFDSAQLSLQRGLLPRFAVVIKNVRMESANECWMAPQLLADEIRLPLSFWTLLRGENPITQVEGGLVEFRLRSEYKNCENDSAEPVMEGPQIKQFVTLKKTAAGHEAPLQTTPQVDAILIDQLKVSSPQLKEPLEFSAFAIRLKSNTPRLIEMTAKTHLVRDSQVGDYLSHATVWGEYTEFPKKTLKGQLSGNWREGSYRLKANYSLKEERLSSELELKHIPLNQVARFLKKMNWLREDLSARQVWVSLNAQMEAKRAEIKSADVQVRDFRLEGDLGDVISSEIRLLSLDPLTYAPFSLEFQKLSLEKLLALQNRPHPSPALGQLGYFTGTAHFKDQDHIEVAGEYKGLEFIFSNKGQREVQTLKESAGTMSLQKDQWSLRLTRFVPEQGAFEGDVQIKAGRGFKNMEIRAKVKELQLAPRVVKLMTAGGKVGAFSGDLNMKFQEGRLSFIKGLLNADDIEVEGVHLEKTRLNFDTLKNEVSASAQVQRFSMKTGSPALVVLKDLIQPAWIKEGRVTLKNLSAHLRLDNLRSLSWRGVQAQIDKGGKLTSEGEWSEEGYLTGQVQTSYGKSAQSWILGGRRDMPVFTPTESAGKRVSQ